MMMRIRFSISTKIDILVTRMCFSSRANIYTSTIVFLLQPAIILLIAMLSETWFPLVNLCCIVWIGWLLLTNWGRTNPPLPPGPKGLPIVGMLPFLDPQLHTYFARLAQSYGPLMSLRLGKKLAIIVSSPSSAKQLLKDFDVPLANHDVLESSKEFAFGGKDLTFSPYGPDWRILRKVSVSGMLGQAAMETFCNIRRQWLNETILQLRERAGHPVNIGEEIFLMVLNMITSILWGEAAIGNDSEKDGAEFRREVIKAVDLLAAPNVSDFFPGLARFDLQGIAKKMRESTKRMHGMVSAVIDERRKKDSSEDSKDFLQYLLQLMDSGDAKTRLTMTQTKALLLDMIVAGTDTTSNTVEFAMSELVKKPEVMKKAQQELEQVVGANNRLDESHIQQLPYLHAIMKETLRLHPVLPLLVPRCPSETFVVGGYTIPKGSSIFFNVWDIHRDPSHWEDPLVFKPERFINKKHDFTGNDFSYLPFGSGRRICVGVPMAERIIMLSLASLLHNFDWELPTGIEELDLSEKFGFTLKKTIPLLLIPSPRSSNLGDQQAT